jgi:pyruvate formate lyase activating enzyme
MITRCDLCPKYCLIKPGQSGDCRVRVNIDGKLRAVTYGYPVAVHVDPVEKKPLNHFLPGSAILSIATVGCNLHCKNCQNWQISQLNPEHSSATPMPPRRVSELAKRYECRSVAYTYTDPTVFYEYTRDACIEAHKAGLKNALVTAGYINEKPLRELYRHVDAANIDLKAMSDRFYIEVCGATLKPVLNTLTIAKSMGVLVEVTNLLIPTLNDSDDDIGKLCRWIKANMGWETPIHFSRFHPHYQMRHLPPTPAETLKRARQIARASGLKHIYVGNILMKGASDTHCGSCGTRVIKRTGYRVLQNRVKGGKCPKCKKEVYGIWN